MTIKLLVIPGWAAPSRGRVAGCHAFHPAPRCAHSATSIELFAYPAKPTHKRQASLLLRLPQAFAE